MAATAKLFLVQYNDSFNAQVVIENIFNSNLMVWVSDPEFKGVVTEERFKSFLRRSSLQDRLSQTELRRLVAKCKASSSKSNTKRRSSSAEVMFDYEKFYQLLTIASSQENSIGGAKAEAVFGKFREAAMKSAANGRSFISLCSLLDHSLKGQMSREEFIHTAKMMEYSLSNVELESLLNYLVKILLFM